MNRLKLIKWLMVSVSVVMLSACGGGSSGSSAPVAPTPEEIQAEAIETINNYDGSGEAPTVDDYANAGVTDVNEGNIDSVNEAIGDGNTDTQDDIQDISDEAGLVYEDGEDGLTTGWYVYDNDPAGAKITNVDDPDKAAYDTANGVDIGSRVIQFTGAGTENAYQYGDTWNNTKDRVIQWSMKSDNTFIVYVHLTTKDGDRHFTYYPVDNDKGISDDKIYTYFGLGADADDGTWKTYTRNLVDDLNKFEDNNEILTVNYFKVRGSFMVDDIRFSESE